MVVRSLQGSKDNMSLVIIAFPNAPMPTAEWKAKDEALDNEIRKKTIGKGRITFRRMS